MKQKMIKRALMLVFILGGLSFFSYQHQPDKPNSGRFIKLDAQGKPMADWHGPWSCIYDNQTGLIWENKTDDEGIHDALWTYSWYLNETGTENAGDCYFEADRCDTQDLIRRVNSQGLCGLTNWRLPSSKELLSLVNTEPATGYANIYNDYFSHTKRGDYWSGDSNLPLTGVYAHLKSGAMAVDFIQGQLRPIPYRNAAFVRLVSAGK